MKVIETNIPDVKIIEPTVYGDERGYFMETWQQEKFDSLVAKRRFVQDNESVSAFGTLRGLHYQTENTQGKLVRVISGEVFDVAVDVRKDSPTLGQWVGVYLSEENKRQLWVPEGFAHGFLVTSESAKFVYKCTDYYNPEAELTLAWNDTVIDIEWPIETVAKPILSNKDSSGKNLREFLNAINHGF